MDRWMQNPADCWTGGLRLSPLQRGGRRAQCVCGWSNLNPKVTSVPFEESEAACLLFMWEHLTLRCGRSGGFDQRVSVLLFQALPLHLHTKACDPPTPHPQNTPSALPQLLASVLDSSMKIFFLKKKQKKQSSTPTVCNIWLRGTNDTKCS